RLILGIGAGLAMASRPILPFALRTFINRKLACARGYHGEVGNVDLHLLRGEYSVHDIKIVKAAGGVRAPFFSARTLGLSLEWQQLFQGCLVGEVYSEEPKINIVSEPAPKRSPTSKKWNLSETLESIYSF